MTQVAPTGCGARRRGRSARAALPRPLAASSALRAIKERATTGSGYLSDVDTPFEEIRPAEVDDLGAELLPFVLAEFVKRVRVRFAVLVDEDGRGLASAGRAARDELEAVRGVGASSLELANVMRGLLGRQGVLVQTRGMAIELTPVGPRRLVATVFEGPLDGVRSEAAQLALRIRLCLEEIAGRNRAAASIARDFGQDGSGMPPSAMA